MKASIFTGQVVRCAAAMALLKRAVAKINDFKSQEVRRVVLVCCSCRVPAALRRGVTAASVPAPQVCVSCQDVKPVWFVCDGSKIKDVLDVLCEVGASR
jgi:hypothetical protein